MSSMRLKMTESGHQLRRPTRRKRAATMSEVKVAAGREWTRQVSFVNGEGQSELVVGEEGIAPNWHLRNIVSERCEEHPPTRSTVGSSAKA